MTMPAVPSNRDKSSSLLRELSDDEDDTMADAGVDIPDDPQWPWLRDYCAYMDSHDQVLEGWTAVQWWGVRVGSIYPNKTLMKVPQYNSQRYHPAWRSLAHDYLAVMSSSVSSKRAFSQGGITVSKHRNRLKGDIVEALQCIKSGIRQDLLFRDPGPSSRLEAEECDEEMDASGGGSGMPELNSEELSWEELLIEDDDEVLNSE
jgi:hypothetical protein